MRTTRVTTLYGRAIRGLVFLFCLASVYALAAGGAMPADSIVVGPSGITYQTRQGDTLISIAQQWTTKSDNWSVLAKVNHINQDSNIPIGTPIMIPADLLTDEPSQARVVALSGDVSATGPDGQKVDMKVGATLAEGAQIETGVNGFLTMSLPDASRISLPSNSRVRFNKLRMARFTKSPRTELMLMHGHVESRVSPLETNKGSYEVRTPTSVAGVRGTQFRVGTDGDTTTNEVVNGKVAVGNGKPGSEVVLDAGKGNVVTAKGVGQPLELLPAPSLAGMGKDGTPQVRLNPVPGAASYHVQVSNDPDGQDVLAEAHSKEPQLKFASLHEGAYYLRMSAIDKHGLEGYARIQQVSFSAHPAAAPGGLSPYVDGSDSKQVTLRWQATAKESHLQVSRDAQFSWLIYNTNTDKGEAHMPRPDFGTYYARVQGVNPDGSTTPFSPPQAFIVTDHWVINDGGPAAGKRDANNNGNAAGGH
ncbi:MAG TPA: FecR domain-containing protein [Burkholderiaceae bacterium]